MQIKENIKAPRHWPLCGDFSAQMASNAENVSIWWRHHVAVIVLQRGDLQAHLEKVKEYIEDNVYLFSWLGAVDFEERFAV